MFYYYFNLKIKLITTYLSNKLLYVYNYNLNYKLSEMNRKNQNQNSSEGILKSKYLERQKPKLSGGSSSVSKKVMLTDLCPQQKLKIGELIKVNESRRQQIMELTQEMNEIREKFTISHSRLIQIEQQFEAKEEQCSKLSTKIEKLQQKSLELEIANSRLALQNKELKQAFNKISSINKENRSCQTQNPPKNDNSTQTKKGKTKNREIQVQLQELIVREKSNSKHHTKSFEKIISQRQKSLKNSYSRSQNEIVYSQNTSSRRNQEQDDEQYKQSHDLLVQQRLDDLAKQWLQLKQRKVSNLKAQYEYSKANFFKEQPNEFTCEDLEVDNQKNQTQQAEQIDQTQLNNLLKSKNFSASRLLTSKGMMNQSQNSRKGSINDKSEKQKAEPKAASMNFSVQQPKLNIGTNPLKRVEKTPIYEKYNPPQSNFYESDFMDLVDSLNQ